MKSWDETWRRLIGIPESSPVSEPEPPAPAASEPDWLGEWVSEARLNWTGPLGQPVAPKPVLAADPAPAPLPGASAPASAYAIAPNRELTRAHFTRLGFEPGRMPPGLAAYRQLLELVYGPCRRALPHLLLADRTLVEALAGWDTPHWQRRGALAHAIFERTSAIAGVAYRIEPARAGHFSRLSRTYQAEYDEQTRSIDYDYRILAGPAAEAVHAALFLQMVHLQATLLERLARAPRALAPAERSLALYWRSDGQWPCLSRDAAGYMRHARSLHAHTTANAVVLALAPHFGWQVE